MKIDQTSKSVVTLFASEKQRRTEKSTQADTQQSAVGKVDLTSQLHASDPGQADGAFDSARVMEIKHAIAEGRFKVNADVVADRLLETVKELLQTRNLQ